MRQHQLYLLALGLMLVACNINRTNKSTHERGELIFHSGFEPNSTIIPRNGNLGIIGVDQSVRAPNDWTNDLDNHPDIGSFGIQFEGGDSTTRYAKIVADPRNPLNHVLQFWLNEPSQKNGRIQGNIYGNHRLREIFLSVKMFLPLDFNTVRLFPKEVHWLTIAEFWNNITWSQTVPYGFRITLGIGKEGAGENNLHFILDAQDCQLFENGSQKYTTIWAEMNRAQKIPLDEWFTMEYYYKEGDANNGRFYMRIIERDGASHVVFDVKKITHNTHDPAPDGLGDFNPIKLYTSKDLVDFMHSKNKTLQIYWDDFQLWKDRRP